MDVVALCTAACKQGEWPLVFVLLFAGFLSIDASVTAFSLFRTISRGPEKVP
jgi:hypothetical protein